MNIPLISLMFPIFFQLFDGRYGSMIPPEFHIPKCHVSFHGSQGPKMSEDHWYFHIGLRYGKSPVDPWFSQLEILPYLDWDFPMKNHVYLCYELLWCIFSIFLSCESLMVFPYICLSEFSSHTWGLEPVFGPRKYCRPECQRAHWRAATLQLRAGGNAWRFQPDISSLVCSTAWWFGCHVLFVHINWE